MGNVKSQAEQIKQLNALRDSEVTYCRDNLDYYIDNYVKIEDKDALDIIPYELWPMQRDSLHSIAANRLNIILKARQLGVTWLVLAYSSWCSLRPGWVTIALSRTEEEAKELIRRMEIIYKSMPELMREDSKDNEAFAGIKYKSTALTIELRHPNGMISVFKAFPSASGAARSFTANLLILDEWAFQAAAEEIWLSAYPTVNRPTGGQVIGLSTIDRGTLFERLYTEENNFNKLFLPWHADPRRTIEWYEQTRKDLGDMVMQEYPATVDEALRIPGGAFFPEVKPHIHLADPYADTSGFRRYVCLDYGLDMLSVHWVWIDRDNNARVYRELDEPNLTISEACKKILASNNGEKIEAYLAPPDLWSRSTESGKSRATIFYENGVLLTRSSNDFEAGCNAMKEWLKVPEKGSPSLMIDRDAAPNLFHCLCKIMKDKKRPIVYETKTSHELTHDVDSLRYFAVYYTKPAAQPKKPPQKYAFDVLKPKPNPLGRGERIRVI